MAVADFFPSVADALTMSARNSTMVTSVCGLNNGL